MFEFIVLQTQHIFFLLWLTKCFEFHYTVDLYFYFSLGLVEIKKVRFFMLVVLIVSLVLFIRYLYVNLTETNNGYERLTAFDFVQGLLFFIRGLFILF